MITSYKRKRVDDVDRCMSALPPIADIRRLGCDVR